MSLNTRGNKKICTWVQEYKSHKLILIRFAQAALLIKKQQKERTQEMKGTEQSQGHSVWISPYHCHVPLCLKSPRGGSWGPAAPNLLTATFGARRVWREFSREPRLGWITQTHRDRLTLTPHCSPPEDSAKGRSRESQAQLQLYKSSRWPSWVNFARARQGWSTPSLLPRRLQPEEEPAWGGQGPLPSRETQGISGARDTASTLPLESSSAQTPRLQLLGRDEETNVSEHTRCWKAQTECWPNFNLDSPFEENFESIRQYEL